MLIKLAVLGGLGYAGYKYFNQYRDRTGSRPKGGNTYDNAVDGGPLSSEARLQHSPDAPPTGERPPL